MSPKHYIQNYIHIKNEMISLNGKILFRNEEEDFLPFIKNSYKFLDTSYPKFFKMDNLSKLAFLAADVLLKAENLVPQSESENENNIALIFSNRASSLDTDRKHQMSIEKADEYFPSPAVFVYTLPNICLGEISIKFKLHSENSFFIFERFNPDHLYQYATYLLRFGKADKTLCGWVELDNNNYEAFLYLVGSEGKIEHRVEEINRLYHLL